jgi:hypothetical protein
MVMQSPSAWMGSTLVRMVAASTAMPWFHASAALCASRDGVARPAAAIT